MYNFRYFRNILCEKFWLTYINRQISRRYTYIYIKKSFQFSISVNPTILQDLLHLWRVLKFLSATLDKFPSEN